MLVDPPFSSIPFVVVDVETTGGSAAAGHRVTEVAAVVVQGGEVHDAFHSLVNPGREIPPFITSLTGISDEMVRDAPPFEAIAGALAEQLAGRVFVAHNARFDWSFLSAEYARVVPTTLDAGDPLEALATAQLCTVRLARRLLRHLPRRNLDALCWHYGVTIEHRHRAAGDARATAKVLLALLADAERQGVYSWEALEGLLARGTGATRKRRSAAPGWSDGAEGV
ncbi:MAG: hypothetical protein HYR75_10535 [Gemmatimonadetes bacterium]|nr:hypothetical protein [Gemmatimonadota bacterium]MBI3567197.1 hypothetical protein [Gemmatimonadota bacterium]